ncbi:MAG: hypothetical protein ACR2QG_07805, partial [Gammaproteobacteria bacterium]
MSAVGVGQWSWNSHKYGLVMDPVARSFFGFTPEEDVSQQSMLEKLPAEDVARYRTAVEECEATGIFSCEFRINIGEDQYRYLSGRGHAVIQESDLVVIKGVFIDVTATKQLEQTLKSTQATMQALVDGIPGLFSYIDKHYRVWFMSSEYRDIFGKDLNDLIGVHIKELIGAET